MAGAERDPRELQPHLHDVPGRRGPVHGRDRSCATKGRRPSLYTDDGGVEHRLWRRAPGARDRRLSWTFSGAPRPTSPTGTIATRRPCAIATRSGPTAPGPSATSRPWKRPGLLIQPYHRILSEGPTLAAAKAALAGKFLLSGRQGRGRRGRRGRALDQAPTPSPSPGPRAAPSWPKPCPKAEALFAADTPKSLRALDTYFLHQVVLRPLLGVPDEAVSYVHSLAEAEEAVATKACRLAVLLRGTPAQQIVDVAEAKESMPAKSTFFYPKLPSGLVIHPLLA